MFQLVFRISLATLITRPRRFGKNLGMSMLESFFDIRKASKVLFEGLDIMSHQSLCEEWMNKWPVIIVIHINHMNISSDKIPGC